MFLKPSPVTRIISRSLRPIPKTIAFEVATTRFYAPRNVRIYSGSGSIRGDQVKEPHRLLGCSLEDWQNAAAKCTELLDTDPSIQDLVLENIKALR